MYRVRRSVDLGCELHLPDLVDADARNIRAVPGDFLRLIEALGLDNVVAGDGLHPLWQVLGPGARNLSPSTETTLVDGDIGD